MFAGRFPRHPRVSAAVSLALIALLAPRFDTACATTTECRDVRTGRAFRIPTAQYSSDGFALPDTTLLARLCVGALRATYALPVADGAGGAYVVWIESAGEDCDLRVQRVRASGAPAEGWPAGGRMLCAARGTQTQPTVAPAANGGLWAAWKDHREPARSAVYLTRLSGTGVPVSGYIEGGVRIGAADQPGSDPSLASDGAGGAWLLWRQGATGARRLRLVHLASDGEAAAGWPAEGREIETGAADALHPLAVADCAGGLVLAWTPADAVAGGLRLSRLDASGVTATGWPATGVALANGAASAMFAALAADTSGVYAAWSEELADSSALRLGRITSTGAMAPGWPEEGRGIGDRYASAPTILPVGSGGAYLAWISHADSASAGDVRLTRVEADGASAPGWPAVGVAVTSTSGDELRPRLLSVPGGVLVSWTEDRGDRGVILSAAMRELGSLPELVGVQSWPDRVHLTWRIEGERHYEPVLERRTAGEDWQSLGTLNAIGVGSLEFDDDEVASGEALEYRLRLRSSDIELVTGETKVLVPAAAPLALRGLAVVGGRLRLAYTVPARGESRFELFDVQGRRMLRDVRVHEHAGEVAAEWAVPPGVRAGVFFARLSQGREVVKRRFVVGR